MTSIARIPTRSIKTKLLNLQSDRRVRQPASPSTSWGQAAVGCLQARRKLSQPERSSRTCQGKQAAATIHSPFAARHSPPSRTCQRTQAAARSRLQAAQADLPASDPGTTLAVDDRPASASADPQRSSRAVQSGPACCPAPGVRCRESQGDALGWIVAAPSGPLRKPHQNPETGSPRRPEDPDICLTARLARRKTVALRVSMQPCLCRVVLCIHPGVIGSTPTAFPPRRAPCEAVVLYTIR